MNKKFQRRINIRIDDDQYDLLRQLPGDTISDKIRYLLEAQRNVQLIRNEVIEMKNAIIKQYKETDEKNILVMEELERQKLAAECY